MDIEAHSQNGVLIGCISIIICIFVSIQSVVEIDTVYSYRELVGYTTQRLVTPIATLLIALLMIIFSILMICGIVKKRPTFMAPWLISAVVGIACEILYVGFFNNGFVRMQIGVIFLIIITLEVLMLYPIYNLYNEIVYANEGKSLKEELSNKPAEKCSPKMDVV